MFEPFAISVPDPRFDPAKPTMINGYAFTPAAELSAALGHLLNARIDLETGETKATAINTLRRGITRATAALDGVPQ